jgi:hypothetical protein
MSKPKRSVRPRIGCSLLEILACAHAHVKTHALGQAADLLLAAGDLGLRVRMLQNPLCH